MMYLAYDLTTAETHALTHTDWRRAVRAAAARQQLERPRLLPSSRPVGVASLNLSVWSVSPAFPFCSPCGHPVKRRFLLYLITH